MQTNKLLYIIIGLQVIILISFCAMHFSGMRKHGKMEGMESSKMHMMHKGGDSMKMNMAGEMDHSMHSMMMDMTERMKGKTGDELDKVFLEDMIVHHQGAVDMAVELQKGTARPELQKMATDIIDVQTKEIDMMKTWLGTWF